MSFYLRQQWNDHRLRYNFSGIDVIEVNLNMMDAIWVPDVHIINEKAAYFHDVTVPNRLLHVFPNGDVFYSIRHHKSFIIFHFFTCAPKSIMKTNHFYFCQVDITVTIYFMAF